MPVLTDFEGNWRLDRRIEDHLGGIRGRFEGRVRIVRGTDGLVYREEGELRMGAGRPLRAERSYLWRGEAGQIAVDFADGRAFHHFDPGADRPRAHHSCPPDDYEVAYDFRDWPRWTARWRVRGPRKDYTMLGRYALA